MFQGADFPNTAIFDAFVLGDEGLRERQASVILPA